MHISKPIEGLISAENRFGLWGFGIERAPDTEAELVQEPGGRESCGKVKLKLKTWFYFCPNRPVKRISALSETDSYFASSHLPLVTGLDMPQ